VHGGERGAGNAWKSAERAGVFIGLSNLILPPFFPTPSHPGVGMGMGSGNGKSRAGRKRQHRERDHLSTGARGARIWTPQEVAAVR
jgi:hypothetical protein